MESSRLIYNTLGEIVMDIDLYRLKWDADYWDEVTPTGSEYYCPSNDTYYMFCPLTGMKWRQYAPGCHSWEDKNPVYPVPPNSIPRPPKKAQEGEWDGEDFPPVGTVCEVLHLGETWEPCHIVAHVRSIDGPKAVWQLIGYNEWSGGRKKCFRPLRTQAERLRDELADLCDGYIKRDDYGHNLADAILSRYNLEPKP
jgi:hypothetical protein